MYIGHGGGQQYVQPKELYEYCHDEEDSEFSVKHAVLMGCSSISMKMKFLQSQYSHSSYSSAFLNVGSLCVIGNLHDVTDGDCDKYTMEYVDQCIVNEAKTKLTTCQIAQKARAKCKLRYLMGSAPVVVGLPMRISGMASKAKN